MEMRDVKTRGREGGREEEGRGISDFGVQVPESGRPRRASMEWTGGAGERSLIPRGKWFELA